MKLFRHLVGAALLLALLVPAGAVAAENRTFLTLGEQFPTGDGNLQFGPALDYPSTVSVAGVAGVVTNVTVTIFSLVSGNPDDIDMVLVGPNEEQVMLMSDACGSGTITERTWTFDDAAPTFLSDNGPCAGTLGTFKPSNYEDPALDDLSKEGGGPPPPYSNALSDLAGGSPEGEWELFVLDDKSGFVGFGFNAWALTLEIEPPPPPAPLIQTVFLPAPPALTASGTAITPKPAPTGKRAAALAKCKTKKSNAQKARCKAKARKLPV
jgi:subtilisin-like proprotein convertase family protein